MFVLYRCISHIIANDQTQHAQLRQAVHDFIKNSWYECLSTKHQSPFWGMFVNNFISKGGEVSPGMTLPLNDYYALTGFFFGNYA